MDGFSGKETVFSLCILKRLLQVARMIAGQRCLCGQSIGRGLNPLGEVL